MVTTVKPTGWTAPGYAITPDQRLFTDGSAWNTPMTGSETWYDTPRLHTRVDGTTPISWFVSYNNVLRIYWADGNDPEWTFDMPDYIYAPSNRNRSAQEITRRAPADLAAGIDTDQVVMVVDKVTGDYIEVWNAEVNAGTMTVVSESATNAGLPGWAAGNVLTDPGAGTLTGDNDGVRASNFSWAAGCITGRDIDRVANGDPIDHAIVVSLNQESLIGLGHALGEDSYVAPATSIDFNGGLSGLIRMGSRIGIPSATSEPAGLTAMGSAMFECLQTYGAFVGDFAGGVAPVIYTDANTVVESDIYPLQNWIDGLWTDLVPLLRVADYQP